MGKYFIPTCAIAVLVGIILILKIVDAVETMGVENYSRNPRELVSWEGLALPAKPDHLWMSDVDLDGDDDLILIYGSRVVLIKTEMGKNVEVK